MQLTLQATKNQDSTHTVSWNSSVDIKVHTILLRVWFGKKKSKSTIYYPLYVWAHYNEHNGTVEMNGTRNIDPALFNASWTQANYDGYICQFNEFNSPADQYNCIDSATVVVTKK